MRWFWQKKNTKPQGPQVDPRLCRSTGGAQACKFLMAGEHGFECGRNSAFHTMLLGQPGAAQFVPVLDYPRCMSEERSLTAPCSLPNSR